MHLIERIDLALQHARATRGDLAKALNQSTESINKLARRPGSSMKPENVAEAAKFLKCDLYWLCTGKPPEYTPEADYLTLARMSFHAREVARWLDGLPLAEQEKAFARIYQACADIHLTLQLPVATSDAKKPRGSART